MINIKLTLAHDQKYLVGCSGGPDSIFLLHLLQQQNYDIVVAHINYHKRNSSVRDQEIIVDFCKQHKIKFFILEMDSKKFTEYQNINNFQNQARKIRYDFFKKIAVENKINNLCLGHHRDDFLETAIWQGEIKKTKTSFYGIKGKTFLFGLNVFRPLINYYKDEILEYLDYHQLRYGIDESNNSDIYTRNQIRKTLITKNYQFKNKLVQHYQNLNEKLAIVETELQLNFSQWAATNFKIDFINNVIISKRKQLIFKYLHSHNFTVKISNDKLNAICDFLLKKDHRKLYRIGQGIYLTKKRNSLAFIYKK